MKRAGTHPYSPGLIQDIEPPKTIPARSSAVQRQGSLPIGELDDDWRKQARLAQSGLGFIPHHVGGPALPSFTRVAPLSTLELPRLPFIKRLWAQTLGTLSAVGLLLAASWRRLQTFFKTSARLRFWRAWPWLPLRYDLYHGLHPDWHTPAFRWIKRYALPLAAVLLAIILWSTSWKIKLPSTTRPPVHSSHAVSQAPLPSDTSSSQSATPGKTGSTTGTNTSNVYPAPASGTTAPSAGPATGPSQTGQGIPGVTQPYSITLPGQSVQGSGKTIVSTNPTSITLN